MHRVLLILIVVLASRGPVAAKDLRWPDPTIAVPPLVQAFIAAECRGYQGTTDEGLEACIEGERYGYRAVVAMLTDAADGETAAVRYRACRTGLGDLGGRFHRRRAECIGASLGIKWRFEFSRETALRTPRRHAAGPAPRPAPPAHVAALAPALR